MNTQHSSTSTSHHILESTEDRKALPILLTAIYSPLVLMLGAAFFLA